MITVYVLNISFSIQWKWSWAQVKFPLTSFRLRPSVHGENVEKYIKNLAVSLSYYDSLFDYIAIYDMCMLKIGPVSCMSSLKFWGSDVIMVFKVMELTKSRTVRCRNSAFYITGLWYLCFLNLFELHVGNFFKASLQIHWVTVLWKNDRNSGDISPEYEYDLWVGEMD